MPRKSIAAIVHELNECRQILASTHELLVADRATSDAVVYADMILRAGRKLARLVDELAGSSPASTVAAAIAAVACDNCATPLIGEGPELLCIWCGQVQHVDGSVIVPGVDDGDTPIEGAKP